MQSDLGEHDKMSARGGLRLAPDAIESVCRRLQRKATFRNGTWVDLAEHTAALRSVYSPPSAQPARCSAEGEDEIVRRLFRAHVDEKRQSAEALQRRLEGEVLGSTPPPAMDGPGSMDHPHRWPPSRLPASAHVLPPPLHRHVRTLCFASARRCTLQRRWTISSNGCTPAGWTGGAPDSLVLCSIAVSLQRHARRNRRRPRHRCAARLADVASALGRRSRQCSGRRSRWRWSRWSCAPSGGMLAHSRINCAATCMPCAVNAQEARTLIDYRNVWATKLQARYSRHEAHVRLSVQAKHKVWGSTSVQLVKRTIDTRTRGLRAVKHTYLLADAASASAMVWDRACPRAPASASSLPHTPQAQRLNLARRRFGLLAVWACRSIAARRPAGPRRRSRHPRRRRACRGS